MRRKKERDKIEIQGQKSEGRKGGRYKRKIEGEKTGGERKGKTEKGKKMAREKPARKLGNFANIRPTHVRLHN